MRILIGFLLFLFNPLCGEDLLTLKECYRIALDKNPANRIAKEGREVARESVGIARAPYYPDLRFDAGYARWQVHAFVFEGVVVGVKLPSVIGPVNDYHLNVSSDYVLYDSGKRCAELQRTLAQKGLADVEVERIRQEILLNVSIAFYSLLANTELLQVSEQNHGRTEDHLLLAIQRLDAGAVTRADVYRTQVKVSEAKQDLVKSQSQQRISHGNLNTSMGQTPEWDIQIVNDTKEIRSPNTIDIAASMDRAEHCRPELKAAYQRIKAAHYQVKGAKSDFGPKLIAHGEYGWRDEEFYPDDKEWRIGVGVELPLFTGFELTHKLNRERRILCREQAEYDQLVLLVKQDVWNSHSHLKEAYETIQTTKSQVIDALESMRLAKERYAAGAGILNDLLDAQTALAKAETSHVGARWNYHIAEAIFQWSQGILGVG